MKTNPLLLVGLIGALAALPAQAQKAKPKPTPKPTVRQPKPTPAPGGANQVQGLEGKIGDLLFDGRWRFQVESIQETSSYTMAFPNSQQDYGRYNPFVREEKGVITPKPGYTIFAIACRVKNGQKTPQFLHCYPSDLKTALTDTEENSYPPVIYDMQSDGAWTTKSLLPGSGQKLTVLFAAPPGTKPKDLVFSLKNYDDKRVNNVRVALQSPPSEAH